MDLLNKIDYLNRNEYKNLFIKITSNVNWKILAKAFNKVRGRMHWDENYNVYKNTAPLLSDQTYTYYRVYNNNLESNKDYNIYNTVEGALIITDADFIFGDFPNINIKKTGSINENLEILENLIKKLNESRNNI